MPMERGAQFGSRAAFTWVPHQNQRFTYVGGINCFGGSILDCNLCREDATRLRPEASFREWLVGECFSVRVPRLAPPLSFSLQPTVRIPIHEPGSTKPMRRPPAIHRL